jgi:hypothetical protein
MFQNLEDPVSLRRVLQTALELEHATIPRYPFAAYSSRPPTRRSVTESWTLH